MMRCNAWIQALWVVLVGVISLPNGRAQEPSLADVLNSTPDRANALLYIDVPSVREFTKQALMASDWSEQIGEIKIAADLDLSTLEPHWEIGYLTVSSLLDPQALSKSIQGYVDTIQGKQTIWSPRQSYLVPHNGQTMGVVRPADRKLVGRWLKGEKGSSPSAYLTKQAAVSTKFVSFMLAVDMEDSLSETAILQRLESLESLKGKDLKGIAKTLATVQGLRVICSRKNLDECIISLDLGASPQNLLPVAKEFFVEVLERNQSSIPEAAHWVPSVEGNTLSFRGTISTETMDDMIGVFTLQRQAASVANTKSLSVEVSTSESAKREATQNYFLKTSNLVSRVRDYSTHNTGDRAQWNGKMARRIDELPTLNVDPDLVAYSARVAQGLRGNMVALQQANIQASATAVANNAGGPAYYGNYYTGGYYNNLNEPYRYRAMGQAKGNSAFRALIAEIDQQEADIRRKMTEKYKVQF